MTVQFWIVGGSFLSGLEKAVSISGKDFRSNLSISRVRQNCHTPDKYTYKHTCKVALLPNLG